jgi:TonB family protein
MTINVLQFATLSVKIALVGGLAWGLLYLLRRAPAASRSRLCAAALVAVALAGAAEMLALRWAVKAPVYAITANAAAMARGVTRTTTGIDAGRWLAILWIAGAAFMILRALAGRWILASLRRRSTFLEKADDIEVRIGAVGTPLLCGLARPAVLLPEASRGWTSEQRRMVLAHELTHYRQGDCWTNLLAQLVRATFWFHPAVWLLVSRLSREQELTCDEAVVTAGHSPHDYAAFLLDTARGLRSPDLFACAMAGSGARSLKQRFARLLQPMPRPVLRRRIVLALTSFAVMSLALTAVRPVWSQEGTKQGKAYKAGNGVMQPRVLSKVDPEYSQEARRDQIEGSVLLQAIITPEGIADNITVVKGVGSGLDDKAIEAVSKWTFQPGTKDGSPVPVWVTIEVNFRLK